jgi:actin-related protein 10
MSSASRSPVRSRHRDATTEGSSQSRQRKTSLSLKPSATSSSSTRHQSSSLASSSAASSIRRQSLFGTDDRVVLDIGARVTKIGFSGESRPRDIFSSVEGVDSFFSSSDATLWTADLCRCKTEQERKLIEAQLKSRLTQLFRAIYYQRLMIDPKQRKVIIAENPFLPTLVKRTMCEVLFGNLQVPSICFVPSHLLSTLAIGRTSSILLDVGFLEATLLPIYHGRGLTHTHLLTSPRAGKRLSKRLRALLLHFATFVPLPHPVVPLFGSSTTDSSTSIKGKVPADILTWDFLEEIKAKALLVGDLSEAEDNIDGDLLDRPHQDTPVDWTRGKPFADHDEVADDVLMQVLERRYKASSKAKDVTIAVPFPPRKAVTPATQPSTLGNPSFAAATGRGCLLIPGWIRERAAEVLFEGGDEDELSLVEMILRTLIKLPVDLRIPLASNIYISGGTAMLPGLVHRIRKQVIKHLVDSQAETVEGARLDMTALSLPRVGPARTTLASTGQPSAMADQGVISTIKEETGEGSQTLSGEEVGKALRPSPLTVESQMMKNRRTRREHFECRAISSLASTVAVLNDHAPRVDADGQSVGGNAPSFPANLSSWIGASLMGSLRIGALDELSREVWDEEQEDIEAAKAKAKAKAEKKNTDRPGMGVGKGSFLGTVGGLDLGSYGALSSGARGTFSANTPRSPSAA